MSRDKVPNNYLIAMSSVSLLQSKTLKEWIESNCFKQYETPEYMVSSPRKRPHNRLYSFVLPATDYRVVMKVTHISRHYNRIRRLRALIKHYLRRDANYKAFQCCRYAHQHKLAAPMPLAYWQKRDSFVRVKSYFLYRYVENSTPWPEVSNKLKESEDGESQQHKEVLKKKIIDAVRCLHRAGVRHGDMTAHNILISAHGTDWAQAKVYFIDYDRSTIVGFTKPAFLKQFFDLRDMRKIYIDDASPYDLLSIYLVDDYHPLWRIALAFWRLGTRHYNKNV